ncbi:MAG: transcriptional repressor LexA [Cellulosilyticaceae bacterium]
MNTQLSEKQEQILSFLKQVLKAQGYPPSVREICLAVGLKSTSTVHSHLNKLEEKGFIRRDPTKPRAIEILDNEDNWLEDHATVVPVLGHVTAGEPILAIENIDDYFPLPNHLVKHQNVYMLEVSGESMIKAGILNGDYVIVKQQNYANNGEIVVAMIDEAVTVKRFFQEKTQIRLQPENDTMSPIYAQEVTILGKVIGLYREM